MFDTSLRELKDRIAAPLTIRMEGISPDLLSLLALLVGVGAALFAAQAHYGWALAFWLLNRALDGLDGLLARQHAKQSDFGGYFDIVVDFVVYASVPIGLVMGTPSPEHYLTLAFLLASFYINAASWMYLGAILEKRHARDAQTMTSIVMPVGLIGGTETIVAYCLFLAFPARITLLFTIFAALVLITVIQRLIWAWRKLR
ncbi:MAG: CDP-alcohol phosphatidyltransferase family protein [Chloroflexi bacterium]|nr:CDP-alcohol phosphatidyltransferase family protein [Chloroflexota bacterium]